VWRRLPAPRVLEHLPLQKLDTAGVQPFCQDVRALAARARPGEQIVAATGPDVVRLDTLHAPRSASWRPHPFRAGRVLTGGPGEAHQAVRVERSGRYRAYIAGTFGRAIEGSIDGRVIGAAKGVNTVGGWHDIGVVDVAAGRHELRLRRGGGTIAPGDGYSGELGPLALERIVPRPLLRMRPQEAARRLCGRKWDWIERVSP
jgi:hypothetical protein